MARRDSLPPGVEEQFSFYDIGDPPCSAFEEQLEPAVNVDDFPGGALAAGVLETVSICLPGFDPAVGVQLTIEDADGDGYRPDDVGTAYGLPIGSFTVPLWAPTGTWTVNAQQGDRAAQGAFVVGEPAAPVVLTQEPTSGPRGSDFLLQLAGFPKNAAAVFDIYVYVPDAGDEGRSYHYITTSVGPMTDGRGRAQFSFSTTEDDPPGSYCIRGRHAVTCRGEIRLT